MKPSFSQIITILYKNFSGFCSEQMQEAGLSKGLMYFVLYIGKHPGCSPGSLSDALGFDTGHTTRSLNRLEEGGFIRRQQNRKDRRSSLLYLTSKGEEAFSLIYDLFLIWDRNVLSGLSDEKIEQLFHCLEPLMKHLTGKTSGEEAET